MLQIPFRMSDSHLNHVQNLVGDDVVVVSSGNRINKHAPAAVERLLAERSALAEFARDCRHIECPVLLDVYSNPVRITDSRDVLGLNIGLQYLVPHIVPGDLNRRANAERRGIAYSSDTLSELQPLDDEEAPHYHGLNMTHSIYYVPPEQLIRTMVEQRVFYAYATMHDFTNAAASICAGTVKYHYDSTGLIACQADGDSTVYSHPACHWIFSTGIAITIDGKPWHLAWSVIDRIGDTVVRRFILQEGACVALPLYPDLDILETADDKVRPIGKSQNFVTVLNKELKSPTVDLVFVPVVDAVFFYNLVGYTTGKGKFIPVPRGLIGSLRLNAVGVPRSPALYALLLARAKHSLSQLNFPSDMCPEIAVYAAVSALIIDVEFETVALGTANRLFRRLFLQHGRVLDFEPVYVYTARQLGMVGGIAATTIVPAHFYGVDAAALAGGKVLAVAALAHPFIAVPALVSLAWKAYSVYSNVTRHHSDAAATWLKFRENLSPGPVGRVIHFTATPSFRPAHVPKNSTEMAHLKPGAVLKIYGNPELNPPRSLERRGLVLHGISIQQTTPSYVARSLDNAVQGLSTRVLSATAYESDFYQWSYILKSMEMGTSVLSQFILGPLRNYNDGTFEQWVCRFPAQVQKRLREAKTSLETEPLSDRDLRVEGIVKQEKTGMLDISGEPPVADTRIVLSCSPRANAFLGPFHWSISNVYKKRFWPLPGKYLVWSCAESSEELGAWFDWATAAYSRPGSPCRYKYGDQSRFEKHQGKDSNLVEGYVLRGCGASEAFVKADRKLKTVHGNMQGMPVSFSLEDPTRLSGGADTSRGNFVINSCGVVYTLGEPGPDTYAVAIKGDDFIAVGFADAFPDDAACVLKMGRLGLSCDFDSSFDVADVEFASNLPYPSSDGTVWGPKIGRVLHRFGWSISSAPPDVYGAATSLVNTVNHIPFLRQFIDAHRRLSTKSDGQYFKYKLLAERPHEATAETYAFIARRYGLNAELENAFVERLAGVTSLPAAIDWPLIDTLTARDA